MARVHYFLSGRGRFLSASVAENTAKNHKVQKLLTHIRPLVESVDIALPTAERRCGVPSRGPYSILAIGAVEDALKDAPFDKITQHTRKILYC